MPSLLNPAGFAPQLADGFIENLCESVYNAMVMVLTSGIELITDATDPDLTSNAFMSQFTIMQTIGLYVIVPMMLMMVIFAIMKGSLKDLLSSLLVAVPLAVVGTPISIMFVRLLQAIDNSLVDFVVARSQADANGFLVKLSDTNAVLGEDPGIGTLIILAFGAIFLIFALFLLLLEFAFRSVMLSVGAIFLPLAIAAAVWAPARRFFYTLTETVIVLIFSKFIAVATLFFGLAMAFGSLQDTGWDSVEALVIAGLVITFAASSLPILLTFVFGRGVGSDQDLSSKGILRQSPLGLSNGRQAARSSAIKGVQKLGKSAVTPK